MKAYVNWEWEVIFRTEVEARDFMIREGICYDFDQFLSDELGLSVREAFDLVDEEKAAILRQYATYLAEETESNWEVVEI